MITQDEAKQLRIGNVIYDHKNIQRIVAFVGEGIVGVHNDIGGVQRYESDPIISPHLNELSFIPLSRFAYTSRRIT